VEHDYTIHVISPHKKQQRDASCDFGKPATQLQFMVSPTSKKLCFLQYQTIIFVAAGEPHSQPQYQTTT
jgi:hypothetical protein